MPEWKHWNQNYFKNIHNLIRKNRSATIEIWVWWALQEGYTFGSYNLLRSFRERERERENIIWERGPKMREKPNKISNRIF
jgi:hypothetical protein